MQNKINTQLYIMLLNFVIDFKVEYDRHEKGEDFRFSGYESSQSQFDVMNESLAEIAEELFRSLTGYEDNIINPLVSIRKSLNIELNEEIIELEDQISEYQ